MHYLRLDLATNCNLRCIMCQAYNSLPKSQVSFTDFELFTRQTKGQLANWENIQLGNQAEPLIHPRFDEFLKFIRSESKAVIHVVTNGKLLDRYAQLINETGNCLVQVSLDSVTKATHEYIRQGSQFEHAVANLALLDTARTKVLLTFTLMRANIGEYAEMVCFCRERGYQLGAFPMFVREDCGIIPLQLLQESLWFNREKLKDWVREFDDKDYGGLVVSASPTQTSLTESTCKAHVNELTIDGSGQATLCAKVSLGNLGSRTLADIWESAEARSFREQVNAGRGPCHICNYRQRCLTPSMSRLENHFSESLCDVLSEGTKQAIGYNRTISDAEALDLFIRDAGEQFGIFEIGFEGGRYRSRRLLGDSARAKHNCPKIEAATRHELHKQMQRVAAPPQEVVLLETYHDYNLVGYLRRFWAAPLILGHLNLTQDADRTRPEILSADTLEELKGKCDAKPVMPKAAPSRSTSKISAMTQDPQPLCSPNSRLPVNGSNPLPAGGGNHANGGQPILLQENYHGFNLVGYRGHVYALAVSLGPVDLPFVPPAQIQAWQQQGLCLISGDLPTAKSAESGAPAPQSGPDPCAENGNRMFSREKCLRYDGGETDRRILQTLLDAFCPAGTNAALCGLTPLTTYFLRMCPELKTRIRCILADEDEPSVSSVEGLPVFPIHRVPGTIRSVFVAHTQWRHLTRISGLLPRRVELFGLDSIVRLNRALVPHAWVPKPSSIYPLEIPEIEIRAGLDMVLMDLPARSIAQMPAGLAYVHNALKLSGIEFQTVDCDLVLYHRFHAHRVLDGLTEVRTANGYLLPEDPWQPAHYLQWDSDEFLEYFQDDLDEIIRKLIQAAPKILGLSLQQANLKMSGRVIRALKQARPETVVVVGGMSCLHPDAARMIMPEADYIVVGEADLIIGPLVQALLRGERPANLPGVWSRGDAEGRSFVPGPLPMDLDQLEQPRYEWTNIQLYRNWNGYQLTPVVGSRGCHWARCTFCAERFKWRSRDPIKIVDELEWLHGQGFTNLVFNESDFHGVPELVRRMCEEIIRRDLKLTITAQLRCHKAVDLEYFRTLRRAGVGCLRFGIDGGSANALRLEKKGYTKEMIRRNLRDSTEAGIFNEVNLVVGVPGETEADVDETIEFLQELQPHIGRLAFINPLMMFRGSDYWNEPEKHGVHFHSDREKLRQSYPVAIPDPEWHSEGPYIDHEVRYARVNRIVSALRVSGMPLGDYAHRMADRLAREENGADASPIPSLPESEELKFEPAPRNHSEAISSL